MLHPAEYAPAGCECLRVNGEAIYGTRPWETYKDGDVRFTRKGNTLYAIALQWPEAELRLTSLAGRAVETVEMLGLDEAIVFKQDSRGLVIQPPAKRPCRYAYTLKLHLARAKAQPSALS